MQKITSFLIIISFQFLFAQSAELNPRGSAGGAFKTYNCNCSRPVGSFTAPTVTVTEVDVGVQVMGYGRESDTEPLPLAIASTPSERSRLACLGTDDNIYIAELDCDDSLVGTPFSIPAVDLQDIYADENGGVVLLTRKATNDGQDNCGDGRLCTGESSQCYAMWLVRFDVDGTVQWETQVTNLSDNLAGYDNGARYVWWYQHHGRIAFDGSNYATYFCIGITVDNVVNGIPCVDIHEGDRMQVVSSSGELLNHPDDFEVGASHSWTTRLVWDPRTEHFVMVCATDNVGRIAQPSPYRTVAVGELNGTLFNGDLVLAATTGYWVAWSQDNEIRLEHFTTGESDLTIRKAGNSQHPHLVSYGEENMLLAWESGSGMTAQIRSASDGSPVGSKFTIDIPDHDFQALKAYPDGSVAYAGAGSSKTSVRIARVMPYDTNTDINTDNPLRIKGRRITFSPDNRHCTMRLDRGQGVAVEVYFLNGKKSERLSAQRFYAAGVHTLALPDTRHLNGIVFIRIAGDTFSEIKKVYSVCE